MLDGLEVTLPGDGHLQDWFPEIRDYVDRVLHGMVEAGERLDDSTHASTLYAFKRLFTQYVVFVVRGNHLQLEKKYVTDVDLASRFIYEEFGQKEKHTVESRTLRLAVILRYITGDDSLVIPVRERPSQIARPYSVDALAGIVDWINSQPTKLSRQRAERITALCLGAGLTAGEAEELRVRDLTLENGRVMVGVYGRRVPMNIGWHQPIRELLDEDVDGDQFVVAPDYQRIPDKPGEAMERIVTGLNSGQSVSFSPKRMRVTWIANLYALGIRPALVKKLSGNSRLPAYGNWRREHAAGHPGCWAVIWDLPIGSWSLDYREKQNEAEQVLVGSDDQNNGSPVEAEAIGDEVLTPEQRRARFRVIS